MIVLAVLASVGCAGHPPPPAPVRPDVIDKMDLIPFEYQALSTTEMQPEQLPDAVHLREPLFYTQTTVIAGPRFGFSPLTRFGALDKIRWETTENFLIARHAVEYGPFRNHPQGLRTPTSADVIAVFRINEHVDLRLEHDAMTGGDRYAFDQTTHPWFRRRYIQVDWSQNLVDGYEVSIASDALSGRLQSEPVATYPSTPQDPRGAVRQYNTRGGEQHLDYFDAVNHAALHPESTNLLRGAETVPACSLGEPVDCTPTEVALRIAFRRIDSQRDYEPAFMVMPSGANPRDFHQRDPGRFGYVVPSEIGVDPEPRRFNDGLRPQWVSRYNLWQWNHALFTLSEPAPTSGTPCNDDSVCDEGSVCHITETPHDQAHRGVCQAFAIHHIPATPLVTGGASGTELPCVRDDDCRVPDASPSLTAVCDQATSTCGEHFVRCVVDEECRLQIGPHSYCDVAVAAQRGDNRGLCAIPFRQRVARQVAYHETENYPTSMEAVTQQSLREWNDAFANAVQMARVRECQLDRVASGAPTTGDDACDTAAVRGTDAAFATPSFGGQPDARFLLVGCHSPVIGTDADAVRVGFQSVSDMHDHGWDLAVCGQPGDVARLGDLRYSEIDADTDHTAIGEWGVANVALDTETGELVSGRAIVQQTVTDLYAAAIVDRVRLLNGEQLPDSQLADTAFVQGAQQVASGRNLASETLDDPLRQPSTLSLLTRITASALAPQRLTDAGWLTSDSVWTLLGSGQGRANAGFESAMNRLRNGGRLGAGTNSGATRLGLLAGGSIESRLLNTEQARLAMGRNPDDNAILPETLNGASPFRGQSPASLSARERVAHAFGAWQCNYDPGYSEDGVLEFAQRLATTDHVLQSNSDDDLPSFGRDWSFRNADGSIDYVSMATYTANYIQHGVLAHEIGHSIGQRHNFAASADAVNYADGYWRHRGQGHPGGVRPRWEYLSDPLDGHYYSPEERSTHLDDWASSSVMEQRGLTVGVHGLGRYDRAFVANTYTNLAEAFRDVADRGLAQQYFAATGGPGVSTPVDFTDWSSGVLHGLHYTRLPQIYGADANGRPNVGDANRYWVFMDETSTASIPGWGDPPFSNVTADGHALVPYRYESENRVGQHWQAQSHDEGADAFESMHSIQEQFLNGYYQNSFAQRSGTFRAGDYVRHMRAQYFHQIQQTSQSMTFDLISLQDMFADTSGWNAFLNSPAERAGILNQIVMTMSADTLTTVLSMPEVGVHHSSVQPDGQLLVTPNQLTTEGFAIPINEGRAFESIYQNTPGTWFFDLFNRAGSYYDKTMALEAITDPELVFGLGETGSDIRQFQVSLFTIYPAQTIRYFGALLSEDYGDYAPIVDTASSTHAIQRTRFATLSLPDNGRHIDATHVPIDPQDHFTIELWSAVMSIAQFPTASDPRYMDYTQLWIDGDTNAVVTPDPAHDTVSFFNPWSHETFRARHFGTAAGEPGADVGSSSLVHASTGTVANEAGIAARMLLHAADLDHQRAAGPAAQQPAAEMALHQFIDLLGETRRLSQCFGAGGVGCPHVGP